MNDSKHHVILKTDIIKDIINTNINKLQIQNIMIPVFEVK